MFNNYVLIFNSYDETQKKQTDKAQPVLNFLVRD